VRVNDHEDSRANIVAYVSGKKKERNIFAALNPSAAFIPDDNTRQANRSVEKKGKGKGKGEGTFRGGSLTACATHPSISLLPPISPFRF